MSEIFAELTPPYSTVVADPPWTYNTTRQLTTAKTRKPDAEANYSTLTMRDIAALPVATLAAANAHLYLWVTNPRLFGDVDAVSRFGPIDIIEAWGFEYRTMLTWRKTGTLGMGYYFRGDTEHVLFATRGDVPIPPDRRMRNWFEAPKNGHSIKPAAFGDLVEQVSPGPYVELFARQPRLGWDSWGKGFE
jgi:N6-adenosine-specific RNA methylase IME4